MLNRFPATVLARTQAAEQRRQYSRLMYLDEDLFLIKTLQGLDPKTTVDQDKMVMF